MSLVSVQIDWYDDFYFPFLHKWAARVRAVSKDKIVFVEAIPNEVSSFSIVLRCTPLKCPLVLSEVLDVRETAAKHGLRSSLVCMIGNLNNPDGS